MPQQNGQEWLQRRFHFAEDQEIAGMFAHGWKSQKWGPARSQISNLSETSQLEVEQLGERLDELLADVGEETGSAWSDRYCWKIHRLSTA